MGTYRLRLIPEAACWVLVALEGIGWFMIRQGDQALIPTLLAYGPRWVWLVPLLALSPMVFWRRSLLLPLGMAFLICLVGPMQLEIAGLKAAEQGCCRITVLTLNAHDAVRPGSLRRVAESAGADILALQEWDEELTKSELWDWNLQCARDLCVASRYPIVRFEAIDRDTIGGLHPRVVSAQVTTPITAVSFFSVHLETVRKGIEPVLRSGRAGTEQMTRNLLLRNIESRVVERWIRERSVNPTIVAGDFNLPTDSAIFRRHWSNWTDAFVSAGAGFGYTKFTSWWGIRIDHVLFDDRWTAVSCRVSENIGSDHRPVIATLQSRR